MIEMDCREAARYWRTKSVEPALKELGFSPTLATVMRQGDPAAEAYERALARRCRELDCGGLTIHHVSHRVSTANRPWIGSMH